MDIKETTLKVFRPIGRLFHTIIFNSRVRNLIVYIVSLLFVIIFHNVKFSDRYPHASSVFGITIAMGLLWSFQSIPLAVTSLIPVFLFPLLGIQNGNTVSSAYINNISMIFTGGFAVALAMERWNLHKRIALNVLLLTGKNLALVAFGFMFTSFNMSMWISNTAAALIMVPNAMAVVERLESLVGLEKSRPFTTGLFLGIAHSCNIGGIATMVSLALFTSRLEHHQISSSLSNTRNSSLMHQLRHFSSG
jgi:sodium-dependent dicarboxylate transporter 2/3/5